LCSFDRRQNSEARRVHGNTIYLSDFPLKTLLPIFAPGKTVICEKGCVGRWGGQKAVRDNSGRKCCQHSVNSCFLTLMFSEVTIEWQLFCLGDEARIHIIPPFPNCFSAVFQSDRFRRPVNYIFLRVAVVIFRHDRSDLDMRHFVKREGQYFRLESSPVLI